MTTKNTCQNCGSVSSMYNRQRLYAGEEMLHDQIVLLILGTLLCRSSKPAVTIREQREAAKAMTQYFRDLNAAKNAEKAK